MPACKHWSVEIVSKSKGLFCSKLDCLCLLLLGCMCVCVCVCVCVYESKIML